MIVSAEHVTHFPVLTSQASQLVPQDKQLFKPSLYFPFGHAVKSTQVVPLSNLPDAQLHLKSEVRMKGAAHVLHCPLRALQDVHLLVTELHVLHSVPLQY
jgi:hypothetical protein